MTSQGEISAMIADQTRALGSLAEALRVVRARLPQLVEEPAGVADLFPRRLDEDTRGKLYRCRGMIQEVRADVNLFCASSADFFSEHSQTYDGEPEYLDAVDLYVVPVPGNRHFYEDACKDGALTDAATTVETSEHLSLSEATHLPRKRLWRDDAVADTSTDKRPRLGDSPDMDVGARALASDSFAGPSGAAGLNLPHPPTRPDLTTACIVTVVTSRDGDAREAFRTNDILDFYGYLQPPADLEGTEGDEEEMFRFSAWGAAELPSGAVRRLLCLAYEPVALRASVPRPVSSYFDEARDYTLRYLRSELCLGDDLLAQYLLLHLCSRVSAHNPVTPVGDIPLLVCCPSLRAVTLSRGIAAIAPVAEVLLTANELRSRSQPLTPKHDNQRNFLRTGTLQVANGSHVTIDCTGLGAGESWYDVLFTAVHKQHLVLEYPYQSVELPINVAFLAVCASVEDVCSPLDFALRVICNDTKPTMNAEETEKEAAFSQASEPVRNYLMHTQRIEPSFDDLNEVHQQISDALVAFSTEEPSWNNRDPLVHNNSFSIAAALLRALATSRGRSDIQASDLTALLDLERQRIARVPPRS